MEHSYLEVEEILGEVVEGRGAGPPALMVAPSVA